MQEECPKAEAWEKGGQKWRNSAEYDQVWHQKAELEIWWLIVH